MYLGGGIIPYNAKKDDRSTEDLKSLKEEVQALLIEMSSVALQ